MHAALRRFASFVLLVLVGTALLASCGPKEPSDESTSTLSNYGNADSATMNSSTQAMMDSIAHADSMHSLAVSNGMRRNSLGVAPPAATPAAPAGETGGGAAAGGKSKYDEGPRAGASPVNAALAGKGKTLFTSKGCVTCHAFGRKVVGPDLKGIANDRTAEWITQQIMHPEVMIKSDPISMQLLAQYKVPMTNQNVTDDEAKALVEYIKQNK